MSLQVNILLQSVYCTHIGVEYMHIDNAEQVDWLRAHFEQPEVTQLSADQKKV